MTAAEAPVPVPETLSAPSVRGGPPRGDPFRAPGMPSLCLVVLDDTAGRAVSMVLLDDSRACYVVGRSGRGGVARDVDVGLRDPALAHRHCELAWDPQYGWHVRDLHSGGVHVDGLPVPDWAPLADGSTLTVGGTRMSIQLKET